MVQVAQTIKGAEITREALVKAARTGLELRPKGVWKKVSTGEDFSCDDWIYAVVAVWPTGAIEVDNFIGSHTFLNPTDRSVLNVQEVD